MDKNPEIISPDTSQKNKFARGTLQVASGTPVVGGIFAVIASAWSEKEQERINKFF